MPVFQFVYHAYGSWHPDHPKGWHQHSVPGRLKPAAGLAKHRRAIQKEETVTFTHDDQFQMIEMALDACKRRGWRCHAAAAGGTHIHLIVSWKTHHDAKTVHRTLKRLQGWKLAKWRGVAGRRWFSEGGDPSSIHDKEHLDFLIHEYFPEQAEILWREGDGSPFKVGGDGTFEG